ncbi:hypothetical protein RFI_24452 [Reticulomyxa filosa]|uniref:Uncharacterized protein n=1 Tax=Reticulomyxa filosa TaxID=46433 RepID=X6MG00_RETFI|nr:hypothetical protein RFI_24452 [Reticulomyxa filosa]|eukprot:ETO12923.1 hypothetical protein RFI_24452 [Reticulomyxa filosa]
MKIVLLFSFQKKNKTKCSHSFLWCSNVISTCDEIIENNNAHEMTKPEDERSSNGLFQSAAVPLQTNFKANTIINARQQDIGMPTHTLPFQKNQSKGLNRAIKKKNKKKTLHLSLFMFGVQFLLNNNNNNNKQKTTKLEQVMGESSSMENGRPNLYLNNGMQASKPMATQGFCNAKLGVGLSKAEQLDLLLKRLETCDETEAKRLDMESYPMKDIADTSEQNEDNNPPNSNVDRPPETGIFVRASAGLCQTKAAGDSLFKSAASSFAFQSAADAPSFRSATTRQFESWNNKPTAMSMLGDPEAERPTSTCNSEMEESHRYERLAPNNGEELGKDSMGDLKLATETMNKGEHDNFHSLTTNEEKPLATNLFQSARSGLVDASLLAMKKPQQAKFDVKNIRYNAPLKDPSSYRKRKLLDADDTITIKRRRLGDDSEHNEDINNINHDNNDHDSNNASNCVSLQDFEAFPDSVWEDCDSKVLQYEKNKDSTEKTRVRVSTLQKYVNSFSIICDVNVDSQSANNNHLTSVPTLASYRVAEGVTLETADPVIKQKVGQKNRMARLDGKILYWQKKQRRNSLSFGCPMLETTKSENR